MLATVERPKVRFPAPAPYYPPEQLVPWAPPAAVVGKKRRWRVTPVACAALFALAGLVVGAVLAVFAAMTAPSVTVGIEYEPLRVAGLAAAQGAAAGLVVGALAGAVCVLAAGLVPRAARPEPTRLPF